MKTENQIVYLLGTGASCNALPLVKGIADGLESLITQINFNALRDTQGEIKPLDDTAYENLKKLFFNDVEWLRDKCRSHVSIDTYAKKLISTRNYQELDKLKIIFTLYFLYSQYTYRVDNRYDAFIAALLNHKTDKLPDHVKVISWNYDIQFEKAMSEFILDKTFRSSQIRLNVVPKFDERTHFITDFHLYKINGSAVFTNSKNEFYALTDSLEIIDPFTALMKILFYYDYYRKNHLKSAISFAWEDDGVSPYVINEAIEKTKDATILVVIGYSFPFFNRLVDRRLLLMPKLKKIYFQAPINGIENIVQSFKSIREMPPEAYEKITEIDQFFLPPEL